ncbi:MAG: DNA N-6-adenine-methyltransferase [Bradyrhizobium sp.]
MFQEVTIIPPGDVAVYDPEKGLQTVAVAEAAEKHWRRPKNSDKLFEAIKLKLTEQAKYVVWRDSMVVPSRKRGGTGANQHGKAARVAVRRPDLPDDDPGKRVAERWRKRLCQTLDGKTLIDGEKITKEASRVRTIIDEGKLSRALDEVHLRCVRANEFESTGTERGTGGTGEFLRYTPAAHVEAARAVLGTIDLDPASDAQAQQVVKAEQYFTAEDDGLKRLWLGNIFVNPPYHRDLLPAFVDKLIEEVRACRVKQAIMLTNNCTDTEWFRKSAAAANAICFTNGRLAFWTPSGSEVAPTQGQAFFYFGPDVKSFAEVFREIGFGVTAVWNYA